MLVPGASADASTTFTSVQTLPVPPASNYAGSGGGDGWAVALSPNAVFNVFHHQDTLSVACHFQVDQSSGAKAGSSCWETSSGVTIRDANGNNFATGGHPGLYLDQATGKLYVYATRVSDQTSGVVCIDTTPAAGPAFCGFTALSSIGGGEIGGNSYLSDQMQVGSRLYAVNFVDGAAASGGDAGDANTILCFDLSTHAACSGQPYPLGITGTVFSGDYPPPAVAAIGTDLIIPVNYRPTGQDVSQVGVLACFDTTTQKPCSGSWPVSANGYPGSAGAPFPLLDGSGTIKGVCIPYGGDPCWGLDGSTATTPNGLAGAIGTTGEWNGPAVVVGPRVYVPDSAGDVVECFDYNTGSCGSAFPRHFVDPSTGEANLELLYTVNPDPQRPSCLWVNSDGGAAQIQNFDAFTGGACGAGPIRVFAKSFVVAAPQCTPGSYTSIQVTSPAPTAYAKGSIQFADPSGNPLPGVPAISLDGTGTASLQGLNLNTSAGLPQFLITLSTSDDQAIPAQSVTVKLTWTGTFDPTCSSGGQTVVTPPVNSPPPPPPPPPTPNIGVTVSAPAVARVGNNVTFKATVTNTSQSDTETGAQLKAPVPAGSTLVSVTPSQGICPSGTQIYCALGTIAPGGTATVTVVVTAKQAGALTFSPTIAGDHDTSAADNSTSASTPVEEPGAAPPAPPAPTTPGTLNAISVGTVVVNGVTIPPDTLFLLKSGDSVQLNGTLVFTTIGGSVGIFSNVPFNGSRSLSSLLAHLRAAETGPTASFTVAAPQTAADGTMLTLTGGDFASCTAPRTLSAKPSSKLVRQLWGKAHGKFTTVGHYSSATIRGTTWGVQDRCDGTLTTAVDDVVTVVDTVLSKTVTLNPGQTYLAQPAVFKPPTRHTGPKRTGKGSRVNSVDSILASGLRWGGKRFKTEQPFMAWLAGHGSSWRAWAKAHPVLAAALVTR